MALAWLRCGFPRMLHMKIIQEAPGARISSGSDHNRATVVFSVVKKDGSVLLCRQCHSRLPDPSMVRGDARADRAGQIFWYAPRNHLGAVITPLC